MFSKNSLILTLCLIKDKNKKTTVLEIVPTKTLICFLYNLLIDLDISLVTLTHIIKFS